MKTILVTGAGGPLGVNVTRSLRRAPEPVRIIGTDANPWHRPLAISDEIELIPRASAGQAYLDAINGLCQKYSVDLLLPTHPVEVQAQSAARKQLAAPLFLPTHESILMGSSKWRSYQKWKAEGIPVPRTDMLHGPEDLEKIFSEVPEPPVWVRGAGEPGAGIGVASLPCRAVGQAISWVEHWNGWGGMIASEYLPGDNLTWMSLWKNGELISSQSRIRLEYVLPHVSPSGITGAPAVSATVHRPELNEIGPPAVRAIDPEPNGIYFLDFKGDTENNPRITEINCGRFGTTIHFYTEAGINYPWLYTLLALDLPIPDVPKFDALPAEIFWIRTLDCGPILVRDRNRWDLPAPGA